MPEKQVPPLFPVLMQMLVALVAGVRLLWLLYKSNSGR